MEDKIFITSVFCLIALVILAKLDVGIPVEDHPKTAYLLGSCSIFFGVTAFVSGIIAIWF